MLLINKRNKLLINAINLKIMLSERGMTKKKGACVDLFHLYKILENEI